MISMAGSIESCDCLVTLYHSNSVEIDLKSDVYLQYGKQIKAVVNEVLSAHKIDNVKVVINDKGALDYTIKARLITALQRGNLV